MIKSIFICLLPSVTPPSVEIPKIKVIKEAPAKISPSPILVGTDKSPFLLFPSFTQIFASIGENTTQKIALTEVSQGTGIVNPPKFLFTSLSASKEKDVAVWYHADQNIITNRNMTIIALIRFFSVCVKGLFVTFSSDFEEAFFSFSFRYWVFSHIS